MSNSNKSSSSRKRIGFLLFVPSSLQRALGLIILCFVVYIPYSNISTVINDINDQNNQHVLSLSMSKEQQRRQGQRQQNTTRKTIQINPSSSKSQTTKFFIHNTKITDIHDYFSATWIQTSKRFIQMPIEKIHTVESACFVTFNQNIQYINATNSYHRNDIKMTLDWFDFSVEHLSKWWKHLFILGPSSSSSSSSSSSKTSGIENFPKYIRNESLVPYNLLLTNLYKYVTNINLPTITFNDNNNNDHHHHLPIMYETIVLIAFMPFKSHNSFPIERGIKLTILNLSATIMSLIQAGFVGRIVIVSSNKTDYETYIKPTFLLVNKTIIEKQQQQQQVQSTTTTATSSSDSSQRSRRHHYAFNAGDIAMDELLIYSQQQHQHRRQEEKQQNNNKNNATTTEEEEEEEEMIITVKNNNEYNIESSYQIELAYVHVTDVKSKYVNVNIPMAALKGLQHAMLGKLSIKETKRWLGSNRTSTRISSSSSSDTTTTSSSSNNNYNNYWKYVYLTEPDTILQTRYPSSIKKIKLALDYKNYVITPHRLQPIPHEYDIPTKKIQFQSRKNNDATNDKNNDNDNTGNDHNNNNDSNNMNIDISKHYIVPSIGKLSNVIEINHNNNNDNNNDNSNDNHDTTTTTTATNTITRCCDDGNIHPGLPPNIEECIDKNNGNKYWWIMCGFYVKKYFSKKERIDEEKAGNSNNKSNVVLVVGKEQKQEEERQEEQKEEEDKEASHNRLLQYQFIKLNSGTGITSIAGTNHGRKCTITINKPCT